MATIKEIPIPDLATIVRPNKEPVAGTLFSGRYQIIEELGQGGMGKVYKVFDTKIKEKIALKLIRPELALEADALERFNHEMKLARKIGHRNVCRMFDLGEADGVHFLTMEYVHGEDLKSMIRMTGTLSTGAVLSIGKQIADGLSEAHSLGIVHRDLKPQNIMIDKHGNVKILDFGIARSTREKGVTGSGVMIGTPEYMSPEQAEAKEVDARADIYSLGIILYEMATGNVPFTGETALSIVMKQKGEMPKNPKQINFGIPDDLGLVILKCLAKDKEKRYQTAAELRSDLDKIEKGLPTSERIVPENKAITSREITLKFTPKKFLVPGLIVLAFVVAGFIFLKTIPRKHMLPSVEAKPSLAILYFENNTGDEKLDNWRKVLADLLTDSLSQSRYLRVLGGDRLFSILEKEKLLEAKRYSSENLLRVAEMGGVESILRGSYTKAGNIVRINTWFQNMRTGQTISGRVDSQGIEGIFSAVDELAKKIKGDFKLSAQEIASDLDKEIGIITTSSPDAYYYYSQGRSLHQKTDFKESIVMMEKAIAIDPNFAMAFRSMAVAYGNLGDVENSRKYYQKALELSYRLPKREQLLIQADTLSDENPDKAVAVYKELLMLYPEDVLGNHALGLTYKIFEDWDNAIRCFEVCRKNKAAYIMSYVFLAECYAAKGMYDKAQGALEDYRDYIADNASIHGNLANNYAFQGKYDLALQESDKAIALNPNSYSKSGIYALQGNLAASEKDLMKMLESNNVNSQLTALKWIEVLNRTRGQFRQAIMQARKGLTLAEKAKRNSWTSYFCRVLGYDESVVGNISADTIDKIEHLRKSAIEDENLNGEYGALWAKVWIQLSKNSFDNARMAADEMKKIIDGSIYPKDIRFYYTLTGWIEHGKGNDEKAIDYLNKALAMEDCQRTWTDNRAFYLFPLGDSYFKLGDLKKSRETFERLVNLTTGRFMWGNLYSKSFYMLGKIGEQEGDKVRARDNYRKFLDLWKDADPGFPEVEDAKQKLAGLKGS